ncbi:MAG: alpha/beta hydrolase, partial [Nanoarchaeota archaeon]|nr:alpha/beta hydrolase [Nanoarchaeota archaeon]
VGVPEASHTQHYFTEQIRSYLSIPFVMIYPGSFAPDFMNFARRYGFIRSFMDSDQRLQYGLMRNITVPTTIIHGDKDTVVLLSGAKIHHELIKNSTLIIYQGGHGQIFGDSTVLAQGVLS